MVRTHDSAWRSLVAAAPLLGVAFVVLAVLQGEAEVATSPIVQALLAGVAAVGAAVAGWTARQLGAAPAVLVAQARAGLVALSGTARPVPGAPPLQSPDGEPCLWFKFSQQELRRYTAYDSIRPFLLVDDSGSCLVLPAGSDIGGSSKAPPASGGAGEDGRPGGRCRLLRDGDALHVVGRFVPASADSLERQAEAARLVEQSEARHVTVRGSDPLAVKREMAALPEGLPPPPATPPQALPVVCDPGAGQPFVITIGRHEGGAGLYRFLAVVDLLVMLGAGVPALWQLIGAR